MSKHKRIEGTTTNGCKYVIKGNDDEAIVLMKYNTNGYKVVYQANWIDCISYIEELNRNTQQDNQ